MNQRSFLLYWAAVIVYQIFTFLFSLTGINTITEQFLKSVMIANVREVLMLLRVMEFFEFISSYGLLIEPIPNTLPNCEMQCLYSNP